MIATVIIGVLSLLLGGCLLTAPFLLEHEACMPEATRQQGNEATRRRSREATEISTFGFSTFQLWTWDCVEGGMYL